MSRLLAVNGVRRRYWIFESPSSTDNSGAGPQTYAQTMGARSDRFPFEITIPIGSSSTKVFAARFCILYVGASVTGRFRGPNVATRTDRRERSPHRGDGGFAVSAAFVSATANAVPVPACHEWLTRCRMVGYAISDLARLARVSATDTPRTTQVCRFETAIRRRVPAARSSYPVSCPVVRVSAPGSHVGTQGPSARSRTACTPALITFAMWLKSILDISSDGRW